MIFEILHEYNLTLGTAIALVEAIALYEQFGFQHSLDARAAARYQNRHTVEFSHCFYPAVSLIGPINIVSLAIIRANLPVASWGGGYRETGSALPRNLPSLR